MKSLRLYYSPSFKQYYSDIENIYCTKCNIEISEVMIHCDIFTKKEKIDHHFCRNCFKEAKNSNKLGEVSEFKIIILTKNIPEDSIPFIIRPPSLRPCYDTDVFRAAYEKLDSEKVIDRAWRSRLKGFMIDQDYKAFDIKEDNKKDFPLNNTEFVQHLEFISTSVPLIGENKTRRLS